MVTIFRTAEDMASAMVRWAKENKTTGFVPTMGALHEGHISLVQASLKENDITVLSVFVNPTQFNDASDLEKYPRNLEKDLALLKNLGEIAVFAPEIQEIYPQGTELQQPADLGFLEKTMEGKHRPGHFQGVVQVVNRLLNIVPASKLYMGQKDFQQFTIIRFMLTVWNSPTQLVVCPVIREESGLAMSSRNERLSGEARKNAGEIFRVLQWIRSRIHQNSPENLLLEAWKMLEAQSLSPEYLEIVDCTTLQPVNPIEEGSCAVVCIAVWVEGVRLIDNVVLSGKLLPA